VRGAKGINVTNSRAKGAAGERELSHELTRLFGVECRRTQQFCGHAGDDDVTGLPGIFCEAKRVQKLNVPAAVAKAVEQCPADKVPAVFHRRNREPWLVTVRLDDLAALATKIYLLKANT
jgi:hypothetical protein